MKRTVFLLVLVVLTMTSMVTAAPLATRYESLEALTPYFPKDSFVYAAIRTDEDYIATLDDLVESLIAQLPEGIIPEGFPTSLTTALDLLTGQTLGASFEEGVRPWLGESLAAGIYPAWESAGGRIVVEITDVEAAAEAVDASFPGFSRRDRNDYIVFAPTSESDRTRITLYSDLLIITSWADDEQPEQQPDIEPNLSSNPIYRDALDRLPLDDYNGIAFIDTPILLAYNNRRTYNSGNGILAAAALRWIGPTAFGAHLLDERTLALDVAQALGNITGLEAFGFELPGTGAALDMTVLDTVPRDAIAVLHGTDPGAMLDVIGANSQAISTSVQPVIPGLITSVAFSAGASAAGAFSALYSTDWSNIVFSNLTGYDYARDIRPLLGGGYAAFLTANPAYRPGSATLPLDGAVVLQVDEPEQAEAFIDQLARELSITVYASGDQHRTRIREVALPGGARGVSMATRNYDDSETTLVAATDGTRLVFGTLGAVMRVFGGEGLGFVINEDDLLANSGIGAYINFKAIGSVGRLLPASDPSAQQLQLVAQVIDRATISVAGSEANDLLLRLTLSIR